MFDGGKSKGHGTVVKEGLPNAVLEPLACGVPICVSDIDQHREILDYNSGAGLLFPAKDPGRLSECIDEILQAGKNYYHTNALDIISNKLNAKYMSISYQERYRQVIQNLKTLNQKPS